MTTMKIKCGFKRFCLLFVSCIVTVDRNISTTYCRSSSGVSVDLFNGLILVPAWLVVIGVSGTSMIFRSKARVVSSDRRHPHFKNLYSTVPF